MSGVDRMDVLRRYPDRVRIVCDEHGFIESVYVGGSEPVPESEVEYVRADLHAGAVDPMRECRIARARGLAQAISECRDDARLDGIREGAAEIVQLLRGASA